MVLAKAMLSYMKQGTWFRLKKLLKNTPRYDNIEKVMSSIIGRRCVSNGSIKDSFDCSIYHNQYCVDSNRIDAGRKISGAADTYWGKNKGRSMEGRLIMATRIMVFLFLVIAAVLNIGSF